jgi:hypothetical protein
MPYSLANDAETRNVFCDLWPKGLVYICEESGLPDKFHLSRFYQLFLGLWDACYRHDRASAEDRAFFERFVRGKVIPLGKADWILEKMIKMGEFMSLERRGWINLRHVFIFLCQHGRIRQPWGVRVIRWINKKLPILEF